MASADVAWLRMESPVNPMTISGVMMTGTRMSRQEVIELFEERLLPYQRFRMRVDDPTALRPKWLLEDPFDIGRHVIPFELTAPGDQDALENAVSDLMSTPLSFAMPPWTIHHVEEYGEGSALIVRLHHCIADGIAMMHVLMSMSDEMWDPTTLIPSDKKRSTSQKAKRTAKGALGETKDLITNPKHLLKRSKQVGGGSKSLVKLLAMRPDSETRFKGDATPVKRAAWSKPIAVDHAKAIAKAADAKINDILLAAATGGLKRYLEQLGDATDGIEIRAAVPFNVRPLSKAYQLGNAFALVFLPLPIGMPDTPSRLEAIRARMNAIKKSSEPAVVFGILQSIGFAPKWVHKLVVKMFSEKCSAVMTNVPGPQEQLHLKGTPLHSMMFWVPQAGDIGLGLSILSLNGKIMIGVAADQNLVSDPNDLVAAFEEEFDIMSDHFLSELKVETA